MNKDNKLFLNHLLRVRKLLKEPIVKGKDLVELTTTSGQDTESNREDFNQRLLATANSMDSIDVKFLYRITSTWMKISTKKILFPLPPRNVQNITLLTVAEWAKGLLVDKRKDIGRALIGQVGTGEGKSLIIAMVAIYFVKVLNRRVHILESNSGLLEKDIATMAPLYAEFGIMRRQEGEASPDKKDLTFTTVDFLKEKDVRSQFCKYGITYALRRNVERYYQDCIMNGICNPMLDTVLIVDEVDALIVDENPNLLSVSTDCQQKEYRDALDHFKDYEDLPEERVNNIIWNMALMQVREAKEWKQGEHYDIVGGTYVLLVDKRPVAIYDGRLEYLKFANDNISPVLKTGYYVQSIPYMLSQYNCITGFSGSLGSPAERKFLSEQYKVWCFETPNFLNTCEGVTRVPPTLLADEAANGKSCVHVANSLDLQLRKVVEIAVRMYMKVPVLIIAKTTEEAYTIEDKILRSLSKCQFRSEDKKEDFVQMFLEMKKNSVKLDSDNWSRIVHRATDKLKKDRYCITITDSFGGRGHDFDVNDDDVNEAGGLLVIMTSIPASEREWRQWKGRTGRKDTRGQYAVVLNGEDALLKDSGSILSKHQLKTESGEPLRNVYGEELIQKILDKQDDMQRKKLEDLEKTIKIGRRLNRLCDQFYASYNEMKEETWPYSYQIKLRNLLVQYFCHVLYDQGITEAFKDLGLTEHDVNATNVETPTISSSKFWDANSQSEWSNLCSIFDTE